MIKHEDLITALRRMAPETGSLHCLGCGYEHNCSFHGCAIIREAADRLTELSASPPNPPLTLEELREMDGEPVYIAPVDGGPYTWMLVDTEYEALRGAHGELAVFENCRKPEEGLMDKKEKGCRECEFSKIVYVQDGFSFIGCHCEPYKGKWVCEIKDCPLNLLKEGTT